MTVSQTELERYLDDWLGNTPMDPADRVVVAVAVRIGRQRQRRVLHLPWAALASRTGARPRTGAFAAATAAVILAGVVGFTIFRSGSGPGGPIPAPSPTVVPSSPPPSSPPPLPIEVSLAGGLPDDWTVTAGGVLTFATASGDASMSVEVLENRAVMHESCEPGSAPGVDTTSHAIVQALADRPGVIASLAGPTVVGGLPGRRIDLRPDPTVGPTCPLEDPAYVPLVGRPGDQGWEFVGIFPDEIVRLIVLDLPDGQNVLVFIVGSKVGFDPHMDDAMTIVGNLTFDITP